jgi:hypothetical protein
MRHASLYLGAIAAVVALGALAVASLGSTEGPATANTSGPGTVDRVAVDVNTSGNDDSTVGTIQDCAELANVGDTLDIDVVVEGVHANDRIQGYQFDLDFDPAVLQIIDYIDIDAAGSNSPDDVTMISRISSAGGAGLTSASEFVIPALPDTDGSYQAAAVDGTAIVTTSGQGFPNIHEPATAANGFDDDGDTVVDNPGESSEDGVLARLTVEAVGTGTSQLVVPGSLGGIPIDGVPDLIVSDGNGTAMPVATVETAAILVGAGTCAVVAPTPTPTPTPVPTLAPTVTPQPTPTPTATPFAGTTTGTATATGTGTATATSTPGGTGTGAGSLPPTGDGIPVQEGQSSLFAWLLIALGAVTSLGAAGSLAYGRVRGDLGR